MLKACFIYCKSTGYDINTSLCQFADVNTLDPLEDKWKAFGWDVQSVDGHDIQQILYAIDNAKKEKGRPSMIILNTIKGKGVYFAENLVACHNMTITEEMWKKAVDMIDKEEI